MFSSCSRAIQAYGFTSATFMKQKPQGFRRIYSGTSDTKDAAPERRMLSSGYDTFHKQKKRETTIIAVLISAAVIGALIWLWVSVFPNLEVDFFF